MKSETQVIREALRRQFGKRYVSVSRGRGTSAGWIYVRLVPPFRNTDCELARQIAKQAMAHAGLKFDTFFSEVKNKEQECLLVTSRGW